MSTDTQPDEAIPTRPSFRRLWPIFAAFAKLGFISFGGPVAHLGYFHSEFVERRKWIDESDYADLVALCQFLPGPSSSQVVFALGLMRGGFFGGLIASLCFTLPSACLLIAFAYGVGRAGDLAHTGWLHGLKLAAVVVVAQAVWRMGRTLCPDWTRLALCVAAAVVVLRVPHAGIQIGVITCGVVVGLLRYRSRIAPLVDCPAERRPPGKRQVGAATSLLVFVALLLGLPIAVAATHSRRLAYFDSIYRSSSLVIGGGHVVLPLLRQEIVPRGWLSDDLFLAGYGAAQAVPGPLFTFAGYLGTAMEPGPYAWLNSLWCLLAIFLPGCLLIGGMLPFWHGMKSRPWAQAALRGAGASVVGILLAALCKPICSESIRTRWDVVAVLIGFLLLQKYQAPSWTIVLLMALTGHWLM